jgi:ABC-type glycerol-3-phosphate transport system permease component
MISYMTDSSALPPTRIVADEGRGQRPSSLRRWLADAPAAYLLLAPVLVLFAFAVVYPLFQTIWLSFWDIKGLAKPRFYGVNNFIVLFNDATFQHTILTTLLWTLCTTALSVAGGWSIALLCALAPRETLIPRVLIFAAFGVSEAVTGYIWLGIYRPDAGGLLNSLLSGIGLGQFAHPWLGDANTALWCLIIAYSWAQTGLPLILIFAATQAVPRTVLEAAYIDGARPTDIMRYNYRATFHAGRAGGAVHQPARQSTRLRHHLCADGGRACSFNRDGRLFHVPGEFYPVQARLRRRRHACAADRGAGDLAAGHHPAHGRCQMIGKAPRWIPIVVGLVSILWIIPLLGIIITSVRPPVDTVLGWWRLDHIEFTFNAWFSVWSKYPLANGFWVSVQLAGISTLGSMILTPAAAYTFQFLKFPFRRTLLIIIINAFVLPQQVVVIPLFTLWRQMGLIDNIASVLIPYIGLSFAWSIFLVKNFLEDFPKEMIEAARIDGCGPISTFFHVVLPNSLTSVAAVGILQFLFCWNSLLIPLLFLRTQTPLPVVFAQIAGTYDPNWDLRAVAAIVTTIVPLIIFLVFQRQFARGSLSTSGSKE